MNSGQYPHDNVQYDSVLLDEETNRDLPGDDLKIVKEEEQRLPLSVSKKLQHQKMRSLGMGKHVAGNASSLANHSRVPGEVAVG